MTEYRSDTAPAVEVERRGEMALVTVRKFLGHTTDDEGKPIFQYDFHQYTDLYTEGMDQNILDALDATIASCEEQEQRQQRRDNETRLRPEKVLEQQSINTMLATTELYEMMLMGGM